VTTPSGRAPLGGSRLGHEYQDLIAWQQALHAAHPHSKATEFHVESPKGASYDDVATVDQTGSRYVQAKHVVDAPDAFSLQWLLEPQGKSGESMAQKALRTFQKLRQTGPVELRLCTNRELESGDPLGELRHVRDATLQHVAKRVLTGEYQDANLEAALTTLQTHLGCDEAEFLELLGVWKLQWAYGMTDADQLARSEMRGYGLRDDDEALRAGTGYVGGLLTTGVRTLPIDELRNDIRGLEIQQSRHYRTLSVAAITAEPNQPTAHVHLDLRSVFEGRDKEQARGLDDWTDVDAQLRSAVDRLGPPSGAPVLVHAAARLPMWFRLGTLMRAAAGWTVACELGGTLYSSEVTSQTGDILTPADVTGSGNELVVTLSVRHDIRNVVTKCLAELGLDGSRRLDLGVASPSVSAVTGPAAAKRIAEQIKTALIDAAEDAPTSHIHLLLACPKPIPLFLGSEWHRLTPVTVYEDLGAGHGYQPAFTVAD
jgi:hypothetical protein